MEDAPIHSGPAGVSGHSVGCEDKPLLPGAAFCSHSHHPSAHVHDRQGFLSLGDEMCMYLSGTPSDNTVHLHKILYKIGFGLEKDCNFLIPSVGHN